MSKTWKSSEAALIFPSFSFSIANSLFFSFFLGKPHTPMFYNTPNYKISKENNTMNSEHIPVPLLLSDCLARKIPAVENNNWDYLIVTKQIDSMHTVVYISPFLITIRIKTNLHTTRISCYKSSVNKWIATPPPNIAKRTHCSNEEAETLPPLWSQLYASMPTCKKVRFENQRTK